MAEQNKFEYEIGGKTYVQKPLVLGQLLQLTEILSGINFAPAEGALGIIKLLGSKLPSAIAVVLTEKGRSPRDKDLSELAATIEFELSPEDTIRIIEDFFGSNQVQSLTEKLNLAAQTIRTKLQPSKTSSSSSPKEISQKGT